MKEEHITPTTDLYESLVSAQGRARQIRNVEEIYDDILARKVRLPASFYETLVRDCRIDKLSVLMAIPNYEDADDAKPKSSRRTGWDDEDADADDRGDDEKEGKAKGKRLPVRRTLAAHAVLKGLAGHVPVLKRRGDEDDEDEDDDDPDDEYAADDMEDDEDSWETNDYRREQGGKRRRHAM